MKKLLFLSLITFSILPMQLNTVKSTCLKAQAIQHKLAKLHSPKVDKVKQFGKSSSNSTKQCVESIYAPQGLGKVELFHNKDGFHVLHNNEMSHVQPHLLNKELRNITTKQVKALEKLGYFAVNKRGNRDFSLEFQERILGGGPLLGGFMYWLTKSVCYGGIAAAAGTAVVTTGGAAVGAIAGGAVAGGAGTVTGLAVAGGYATTGVAGLAGATTIGTTIVTTAGVGVGVASTGIAVATGTGIVATAAGATAAGAVVTNAAVVGTTAAIASGASVGGIILGIEALSMSVGTFFGMLPTP